MPVFESRADLYASAQTVFDFLIKPTNLQKIAPPEMQFVFVNPPELLSLGSQLTCKAQAYGMVQTLKYEIVEFKSPSGFREKMIDGPLRLWIQDYIIEPESGADVVTVTNRIEFEPPGGMMGLLVTADRILEGLEDGFEFQRKKLESLFPKP